MGIITKNELGTSAEHRCFVLLSFGVVEQVVISPQVNTNGDITFNSPLLAFRPLPFPLNSSQIIAPFWADVDITISGNIWYREASSDAALLMMARNEIRMALVNQMNFQPTFLFIATWDAVPYFRRNSTSILV